MQTFILICVQLAEMLTALVYYDNLGISRKRSFFDNILFFTFGYSLLYLTYIYATFWVNVIVFFAVNCVLQVACYVTQIKNAAIYSVILTASMTITELLVAFIIGYVIGDISTCETSNISLFYLSVLSKSLYFFVAYLISRLLSNKKIIFSAELLMIFAILISSVTVLLFMTDIAFSVGLTRRESLLMILSAAIFLGTSVFTLLNYKNSMLVYEKLAKSEYELQMNKTEKEYTALLNTQLDNQRKIMHDIKKHLSYIYDLTDEDDVKNYIENLYSLPALQNQMRFSNNSALNLILIRYASIFQRDNISYCFDIKDNVLNSLDIVSMNAIFGNILDNAEKAALNTNPSFIDLSVGIDNSGNTVISLTNSSSNDEKENSKSGLGLKIIEDALKVINGKITTYYAQEKKEFHTIISIPK